MTTRYRVEYALKAHRRDAFIEFIKGLLAVPFVLHSQPTAAISDLTRFQEAQQESHRRYCEIMRDVEDLVNDHIACYSANTPERSKLRFLVPTVGRFFTPLPLERAFILQDTLRSISSRRFVAPSFNDIRLILNTAQILSLSTPSSGSTGPKLITFDGDVTLYEDGGSLLPTSPLVPLLLNLLKRDINIGIVTAAGYNEGKRYKERLFGLLEAIRDSTKLTGQQKRNLIVLGGESSYMFRCNPEEADGSLLTAVPREDWALPEMLNWTEEAIQRLLDIAEQSLRDSVSTMNLPAEIIRKPRAVGIVHKLPGGRFAREQLEEAVLAAQKTLEFSDVGSTVPFCAFNGGNDVFVDIGDKRLGVLCCQKFFGSNGPVEGGKTLHVGDQFLSAGHNDFKARMAGTTVWVASPGETVRVLEELEGVMEEDVEGRVEKVAKVEKGE